MKKVLILSILFVILLAGCVSQTKPKGENFESLKQECIQACENALEQGRNLTNGPCLLDPMENENWVCDVAHEPRQLVDDKPENQCSSYGKTAKYFIEVTPNCEYIPRE